MAVPYISTVLNSKSYQSWWVHCQSSFVPNILGLIQRSNQNCHIRNILKNIHWKVPSTVDWIRKPLLHTFPHNCVGHCLSVVNAGKSLIMSISCVEETQEDA